MHILITGAAGMIGRKLTARLVADGALNGAADREADAARCRARRRGRPDFTGAVEDVARPTSPTPATAKRASPGGRT